jgi:hypothetical protein
MLFNVPNVVVVVGCVFVGFAASAGPGLVARAAEPDRWIEQAIVPGAGQPRLAEREPRPSQLPAERSGPGAAAPAARQAQLPAELEAVLAQNEELAAHNRALLVENQALASQAAVPAAAGARCDAPPPDDADAKTQLRYWAERLRNGDNGFRGGLTPQQNAALNVLLRRERELDPQNPWHER